MFRMLYKARKLIPFIDSISQERPIRSSSRYSSYTSDLANLTSRMRDLEPSSRSLGSYGRRTLPPLESSIGSSNYSSSIYPSSGTSELRSSRSTSIGRTMRSSLSRDYNNNLDGKSFARIILYFDKYTVLDFSCVNNVLSVGWFLL